MAKKFWGEYKGVSSDNLPVFSLSIVVQDLRSGKMSAQTSMTYAEVGTVPSYANFKKYGLSQLRLAVDNLKEISENAEVATDTRKPVALLTAGSAVAP